MPVAFVAAGEVPGRLVDSTTGSGLRRLFVDGAATGETAGVDAGAGVAGGRETGDAVIGCSRPF